MSTFSDDTAEDDADDGVDHSPATEGGSSPEHAIAVLRHVVTSIVTRPDEVRIDPAPKGGRTELAVTVAKADMGRVIGRRGRVANAIRTVVAAAAVRDGAQVEVEFLE